VNSNEYPVSGREVTPDDVASFLIPDSPASLVPDEEPTGQPPIPSTAELLAAWERQQSAELVSVAPAAAPVVDPLVPRWVWRASAVTVAVSAMAGLVAFVVWGVSLALDAAVSAVSAAAPYLGVAVVLAVALALLCRKRPGADTLSVKVVQSVVVQSKRK
jgi:hypothetical protein